MAHAVEAVFGLSADRDYEPGGQTMRSIVHDTLRSAERDPAAFQTHHAEFSQALAAECSRLIETGDFDIRPCPGGIELIRRLSETPDVMLGLLTGNSEAVARGKLRAAGYDDRLFPVGAYGDEHPDRAALVGVAVRRAEAYAGARFTPADVILIGDTPHDIEAGHAYGARVIAVGTGHTPTHDLAEADLVLDDLLNRERILTCLRGK